MQKNVNIKIGGKAGEGIKTTGVILSRSLSRLGFSLFAYDEYPSLIRGGHNSYQICFSKEPVYSQHQKIDLLIALDEQTLQQHQDELKSEALVLYDEEVFTPPRTSSLNLVSIPWNKISQEISGSSLSVNLVAMGVVIASLGLPIQALETVINDFFKGKGERVIQYNLLCAQAGAAYFKENYSHLASELPLPEIKAEQMVILGNEAIGSAAIASGMKYFAAYPMTPVTSLFQFLTTWAKDYNYVCHQVENEIAAINTLIGASVAGVRTMTATSGGGFSLMTEGLGMTGMAEIPAVIVLGMRPGPATGMPTWTGQGDMRFVLHASQDEFPRVVLAPGDAFEAFTLTKKAFVLSEKYHLPVVILVDKYLGESLKSSPLFTHEHTNIRQGFVEKVGEKFNRYALSGSGVSLRPYLGQSKGAYLANSYEHGEDGYTLEESGSRNRQMGKRLKKLIQVQKELGEVPLFGPKKAKLTLVGFGSTMGPVLEALKQLSDINYLHFNYLCPFPASARKVLALAHKVVCLEGNAQGQLQGLIAEHLGIQVKDSLRKYDGRPFYPEEIVNYVQS